MPDPHEWAASLDGRGRVNDPAGMSANTGTDGHDTDEVTERRWGADAAVGLVALVVAALLALWLLPSYVRTPIAPRPLAMAPWFLPAVATGLIALAGALLTVRARRVAPRPAPAEGRDVRGLLVAVCAVALYPIFMPRIGALPTAILLTLGLLAVARVGWRTMIVAGLGVPLLVWLLFAEGIGVPLPRVPGL